MWDTDKFVVDTDQKLWDNEYQEIIPQNFKCRTCLETSDLSSSTNITKDHMLGKTIKEILLQFVPQMVTSSLVDDFICFKCTKQLRNFTDFIEKFISVEKFLIEESIKNQRQKAKVMIEKNTSRTSNDYNTGINSQYFGINTSVAQDKSSPVHRRQLQPVPINNLLAVPISAKENITSKLNDQDNSEEFRFLATENQTSSNNNVAIIDLTNKNDTAIGNNLIQSDLVCCDSEDLRDSADDLDLSIENYPIPSVTEANTTTCGSLKEAKKYFCNRIVSICQSSHELPMFLQDFSQSKMTILEYGSDTTFNKRILFLGSTESECFECKALLYSPKDLKTHFKKDHSMTAIPSFDGDDEGDDTGRSGKSFQCPFCATNVGSSQLLVEHLYETHSIEQPFRCEKCGKVFKRRDVYIQHIKMFEKSETCSFRKCRYCSVMLSKDEYQKHLETHKSIVCDQCGKTFLTPHTLKMHSIIHQTTGKRSKNENHLCPICGKLLSKQSWRHHLTIHTQRTRNFFCHICPKSFLTPYYLSSHLKNAHTENRYKCELCEVNVKTRNALINHHKLKHSKNYKYTCKLCGEGFSRGDYYRRHMRHHHAGLSTRLGNCGGNGKKKYNYSVKLESKPVKCKFCLKIFKDVYILRSHLMCHVKTMRFKCKFCNMTFANQPTKFRHQKRHSDPNFDLSCTVCWRRMETKEELEQHLARHEESKKYECTVCDEMFSSKYLLRHHMSVHVTREDVEKEKAEVLNTALKEYLL